MSDAVAQQQIGERRLPMIEIVQDIRKSTVAANIHLPGRYYGHWRQGHSLDCKNQRSRGTLNGQRD